MNEGRSPRQKIIFFTQKVKHGSNLKVGATLGEGIQKQVMNYIGTVGRSKILF
jgi:hypothetical protein